MKKLILLLCLFSLGCSAIARNYSPETAFIEWPAINTETTVYVGDKVLVQGNVTRQEALYVSKSISRCYDIPAGTYAKIGEENGRLFFSSDNVRSSFPCDPDAALFVDQDDMKSLCVVTIFNGYGCYKADVKIVNVDAYNLNNTLQTLIYNGMMNNMISFAYIEKDSLQEFTHNTAYDVPVETIVYRGARIQIINADNEKITYKVLQYFK